MYYYLQPQVKNPNRICEECKKNKRTRDNKTTAICDLCLIPTCSMHYVRSCKKCYLTKFKDPDTLNGSEGDDREEEEIRDDEPTPSTSRPPAKRARSHSIINL